MPAYCSRPNVPQYGASNITSLIAGSVATFTCNTGYYLVGNSFIVCQANGSWNGSQPTCLGKDFEDCSFFSFCLNSRYRAWQPLHWLSGRWEFHWELITMKSPEMLRRGRLPQLFLTTGETKERCPRLGSFIISMYITLLLQKSLNQTWLIRTSGSKFWVLHTQSQWHGLSVHNIWDWKASSVCLGDACICCVKTQISHQSCKIGWLVCTSQSCAHVCAPLIKG